MAEVLPFTRFPEPSAFQAATALRGFTIRGGRPRSRSPSLTGQSVFKAVPSLAGLTFQSWAGPVIADTGCWVGLQFSKLPHENWPSNPVSRRMDNGLNSGPRQQNVCWID